MKPEITEYKGIKYRSKLEAEFAYLLTCLQIEFEYEPKTFLLPNGLYYKPDFYISKLKLWIEIRGYDTKEGNEKIEGFIEYLCKTSNIDLLLIEELNRKMESCDDEEWERFSERLLEESEKILKEEYMVLHINNSNFYDRSLNGGTPSLVKCPMCNRFFFINDQASYSCRYTDCGKYSKFGIFRKCYYEIEFIGFKLNLISMNPNNKNYYSIREFCMNKI